jgi:hypothetical protein
VDPLAATIWRRLEAAVGEHGEHDLSATFPTSSRGPSSGDPSA